MTDFVDINIVTCSLVLYHHHQMMMIINLLAVIPDSLHAMEIMDDDFPLPESAAGEEMMELLWHDGTVVMKRCSGGQGGDAVIPEAQAVQPPPPPQQQSFMHEDETASWLQYALDESTFDRDSYVDLFNVPPPPPNPITAIVPPRSAEEIRPPPSQDPKIPPRLYNFISFSRMPGSSRIDPMSMPAGTTARGLTMTESNETPVVYRNDSSTPVNTESFTAAARGSRSAVADIESVAGTHQFSMTSSGGSGLASLSTSVEPSPTPQTAVTEPAVPDRKRKGREDDYEPLSEELEFEASEEAKKQARGQKRFRSAEIHNLSERKRRDRINEKMKTLQELIPGCNKTDKASMLDDAIEYFKSLQFQVQMLSNMGCGMVPMMYPGMQPYMHPMGMGMNRPIMTYPSLGRPGFPIPAAPFHLPRVPAPDPSRIQADPSDQRILNFVDPYHQYLSLQQAQLLLPQDQAEGQSSGTKPSTSKQNDNPEN